MQEIIQHFKQLAQIPHCSFQAEQMREYLIEFSKSCGCEVNVDSVGNIHAYKGEPKICLQSHYDMVCMGKAPVVEVYEEGGYLRAKDSSLGADNGMGIAIMLEAMKRFDDIECLFTSDEEVGLIGANGLEHQIIAKRLLNLDHENDQDVTIGCAGGVDLFAEIAYTLEEKEGEVYEVSVCGLKGGHSGIDIVSNSLSSIKILASFIAQNQGEVIELNGGERINSIPKYAKAKVIFPTQPKQSEFIQVKSLGREKVEVCKESTKLLSMLNAFSHGVRAYNIDLQIVQTSINLALVKMQNQTIYIDLFARSNDAQALRDIEFETLEFFKAFGCEVRTDKFYLPWEPKKNAFSYEVLEVMRKYNPKAEFYAIHAGLECGIIGAKQEGLECCAIGPNIYNPHSTDERCEMASVERIARVVFELLG